MTKRKSAVRIYVRPDPDLSLGDSRFEQTADTIYYNLDPHTFTTVTDRRSLTPLRLMLARDLVRTIHWPVFKAHIGELVWLLFTEEEIRQRLFTFAATVATIEIETPRPKIKPRNVVGVTKPSEETVIALASRKEGVSHREVCDALGWKGANVQKIIELAGRTCRVESELKDSGQRSNRYYIDPEETELIEEEETFDEEDVEQ